MELCTNEKKIAANKIFFVIVVVVIVDDSMEKNWNEQLVDFLGCVCRCVCVVKITK